MIAGIALTGMSVALFSYAGDSYYQRLLDWAEKDLVAKLRRLRIPTKRVRTYLISWTVAVLAVIVSFILIGGPIFGVLFAGIMVCGPWYLIRRMAEKRRAQIEDQLADAMVSLSSAIKAGLSLGQSLEILAEQSPKPISQEFLQMVGEYQMGKPLERVLHEARERLRSENFALFAAAMEASRQSGGRLNETVERIAHSVMELQRLERKIISETAQARMSAVYMAMAPAAVLAMYYLFIDPKNTERLFVTFPGQLMLCTSILMNILAYLWARQILNADI